MKSRKQDFIRLFEMLNRHEPVSDIDICQNFSSPSQCSQAKTQLKSALIKFIGNRKSNPSQNIQQIFFAIDSFLRKNRFQESFLLIEEAFNEIKRTKRFYHSREWMDMISRFPLLSLPEEISPLIFQCQKWVQDYEHFEKIEKNFHALGAKKFQPNSNASEVVRLKERLGEFEKEVEYNQDIVCKILRLNRTICIMEREYQDAVRFSQRYLSKVPDLPFSIAKKENLIVSELKILSALFLELEDHTNFFMYQNQLSSINFTTQAVKEKGTFFTLLHQITWASTYGIVDLFEVLQQKVLRYGESEFMKINVRDGAFTQYYFSKLAFISGKLSAARKALSWIDVFANKFPVYSHLYPFLLEMQLLISIKRLKKVDTTGELSLFESNWNKLKKWVNKNCPESRYYRIFFLIINPTRVGMIPKLTQNSLYAEMDLLRPNPEYQRWFAHSLFPDYLKGECKNTPLLEIRREALSASYEQVENWIKGVS